MKIKSITIDNVHDIDHKIYPISDLQYIAGPNGSGKSTVLQSIQLALLGYVPGTGLKVSDVFKHSKNDKTMFVSLILDDEGQEVTIERSWVRSGSRVINNTAVTPDSYDIKSIVENLELPIFNFNDLLNLTANKLRDFFSDLLADSTDETLDWNKLTEDFSQDIIKIDPRYVDTIVKDYHIDQLKGIEAVKQLNIILKQELAVVKETQTRNNNTIQNLIYYNDFKKLFSTEEEYQKEIEKCSHLITLVRDYHFKKNMLNDVNHKLEACGHPIEPEYDSYDKYPEYQEMIREVEEKDHIIQELAVESEDLDLTNKKLELDKSSYQKVINGQGICPFTQNQCEPIKTLIEEYKENIEEINRKQKENQEKSTALFNKVITITNEKVEIQSKMSSFSREYLEKVKRWNTYSSLLSQAQSIDVPVIDESLLNEDLDSELNTLIEELAKFKANQEYDNLVKKFNNEKAELEIKVQFLKSWIDLTSVNKLQAELGNNSFVSFANSVDSVLQKMFNDGSRFEFYLENKVNTFTFGLRRNNKFIPYDLLSSGEKCMVMLSLLTCLVKKIDSPLKVIMIDDLLDHLDDENIKKFIRAAKSEIDVQYIFAGVKNLDGLNVDTITTNYWGVISDEA